MPINDLTIEALQQYAHVFGDNFQMKFPTGSGKGMNLWDISLHQEKRLINIFHCIEYGSRRFKGSNHYVNHDPHWCV